MPVRFKSTTEYSRQFAPHQSPSVEEQMGKEVAGINSDHLVLRIDDDNRKPSISHEPQLQHKKRLGGPPTSLSTKFYQSSTRDAEYTLLGSQDKFSENVRYKAKNPKTQAKIYKNKENMDEEAPPNKQLRMQKRIKPLLKERHPPISRSPPRKSDSLDVLSPPPAPRVEKSLDLDEVKDALKDKDLKDVLGDSLEKEKSSKTVVIRRGDFKSETAFGNHGNKGDKPGVSVMNEGVQTNMKKGVAISAPEAPAVYALKYKAGVAPPRPIKKFSEYQKQFQWKNGMKASPLLAAEQIVYTSNTELGPYKNESIPKMSEYKREFQPWKPLDVGGSLNLNDNNVDKDVSKKPTVKRSKSAGADLRKAKPNDSYAKEEGSGEAELKEKLTKSHGKIRRLGSEYQANFKAPTSYYSRKGAWKGADPPQMMPATEKKDVDSKKDTSDSDSVPMSNWFAEVVELRRRAMEYRKRAQGTHFSREHLVQLMAKQTECWDLDSQVSSTVRALDLDAPRVDKRVARLRRDSPIVSDDVEVEDLEEEASVSDQEVKEPKKSSTRTGRRMTRLREDGQALTRQQRKMKEQARKEEEVEMGENDDDDDVVEEGEGRQPTPTLKQKKTSACRHHLDLTTPAVGGALLSCPPSRNTKMIVTSRSGDSYVTASDNMEVPPVQKKVDMDHLNTRPILGQPSGDSHPLRDDDASSDRALNTRYVPTPFMVNGSSDEDKENSPSNKGDNQPSKPQAKGGKPSMLTPVQEGVGKTYIKSKPFLTIDDVRANQNSSSVDDDAMSVSMMSVASSASLASEVLERARKRKEFWANGNAGKH